MKRIAAFALGLWLALGAALAQGPGGGVGPQPPPSPWIVNGNTISYPGAVLVGSPTGGAQGAGTLNAQGLFVNGAAVLTTATGANIIVGTTVITGGTNTRVLYDNAGVVGEYTAAQLTAQINLATASLSGALPAWPNNTTTFFRGDGTYATLNCAALTNSSAFCSGTSASNLTGTLQAAQFPALTGDVTTTAGSLATTIAANAVTYAKLQQVAASSLVGNPTGSLANAQGITLGATLTFSSSVLQTAALTGDVTSSANSFVTTVAKINGATLGTTTATSGNILIGSGTQWVTQAVTGAISLTSGGVTALTTSAFANPTASIGLTANNGSATTAMRSDATPALSQAIAPTWTAQHIHNVASTIASATGAALDDLQIAAATTTITGNTGSPITKINKVGIYQPTITDSSAVTITDAASLYVDNAPLAAGSVTITNAWAIRVGAGNVSFPGSANVLGTITSGTWNGSLIDLAHGGTNANLTASNGGIFYSTGSAAAILAGTVTAGQCLLSGSNAAPTWGACSGGAAVSSVTNSDGTLTISPTTGAVVASIALSHANTWTGNLTVSGASFSLSGNITASTWTTSGIRYADVAGTLTDNTAATGTTATAYTSVHGGNTIAATNTGVIYTNYYGEYFKAEVAGSHVTLTNSWALGADSVRIGTSNQITISSAGAMTIPASASLTVAASGTLTVAGTINVSGTFQSGGNTMTFPGSAGTIAALNIASQTITGGGIVTTLGLSTGNVTINCGSRPIQSITNGGAWTLTAPAADSSCILIVTNNASAGATTFSGFTVGSATGAALDTTNGHIFSIFIWRANGTSGYSIFAHQ